MCTELMETSSPRGKGQIHPQQSCLPVTSAPCALISTQHFPMQPRIKSVSSSMSMLKGKGLLYLPGMNLFERGTSRAGQGSFTIEHPPHRQDQGKKRGDRY